MQGRTISEVTTIDRLSPRVRPFGRLSGYHTWSDLLFVHWRVDPSALRSLLPAGVEIDEFGGSAWVGVVPFHMSRVRPWWSPAVPGLSEFHETNVRTYVVVNGEPGVWFFSLEASQSLAVRIARWRWRLSYFRAEMELIRTGSRREYRSSRLWPEPRQAQSHIVAEIGDWLPGGGEAMRGSLEFFLAERYLLFTESSPRQIARGQVHHQPYRLRTAKLMTCDQSLCAAAGIPVEGLPVHVLFSPQVDVEVFPLRPIATASRQIVPRPRTESCAGR